MTASDPFAEVDEEFDKVLDRLAALDDGPSDPTPASPSGLVEGKAWAYWGPMIERRRLSQDTVELVVQLTGRPEDEVAEGFLRCAQVPRYLLLSELADNEHSATVYWGIDLLLAREVAIKIHHDRRKYGSQRALRESQAMARLEHPNVVQIYDMGEHGSWQYCVIEYCDSDLRHWHFGLEWGEILEYIIQAAHGLAFLHQNGFAHGDIKATNILIRGNAKLADFGHATRPHKRVDFIAEMMEFHGGGTAGYVAPEVARQGPGFAGDVFALAVTTYVCLFGEVPFPLPEGVEKTVATTAAQVEKCPPKQPSELPEGLPGSVLVLLERALSAEPERRPSLEEFTRGLQAAIDDGERRRRLRRRVPVVAVGVLMTLVIGFSVGALSSRHQTDSSVAELSAMSSLARAEGAVRMGNYDIAVSEIYQSHEKVEKLSTSEIIEYAERIEQIAETLAAEGNDIEAMEILAFVTRLYKRAGQNHKSEAAQRKVGDIATAKSGPTRSK